MKEEIGPFKFKIVDINSTTILYQPSRPNKRTFCAGFDFFPNSDNYFVGYLDKSSDIYELAVFNGNKKVNTYNIDSWLIATTNFNNNFKIFASEVDFKCAVLKPITSSIGEETEPILNVKYSDNSILVSYENFETKFLKISICNLEGAVILVKNIEINNASRTAKFNTNLSAGVYLYKINSENQEFTGKFEVVK